jgi:hypothetical protein
MDSITLLSELRQRGLSILADDGRLIVSPASQLPDELRAEVAAQKTALLVLLGPVGPCPACGGQLRRTGIDPASYGYPPGTLFWCPARRCGQIVWRAGKDQSTVVETG